MLVRAVFLTLIQLLPWAASAALSVSVDRDPVRVNESFTISIQTQDAANNQPELDVLVEDFEILGTSQETRSTIANRQITNLTAWHVSVMARKAGTLTIPPITVGDDATQPLQITVKPADTGPDSEHDLYLEVDVEPRDPYVQQQVLYTVRLVSSVVTADERISEPEIPSGDAVIEKLGDRRIYNVQKGDRTFRVIESRYALFPQKSGTLTIAQPQCLVRVFDSPGGQWALLSRRPREIRLTAEQVQFQVKPTPDSYPQAEWIPAMEVTIEETISDGPYQAGEPLTRTVRLRANGLTGGQLPQLQLEPDGSLKAYPDRPVISDQAGPAGLTGSREQRTAYIPTRDGRVVLQEVRLPWWNTQNDSLQYAVLPERVLSVLPAAAGKAPAAPDIPPGPNGEQDAASFSPPGNGIWPWLTLLAAVGWSVTAFCWAWSRRRRSQGTDNSSVRGDTVAGLKRLKSACAEADPRRALESLQQWLCQELGESANPMTPLLLQQWLQSNAPELAREYETLQRCLYGPEPAPWDGRALWLAVQQWHRTREGHRNASHEQLLAPLNPV